MHKLVLAGERVLQVVLQPVEVADKLLEVHLAGAVDVGALELVVDVRGEVLARDAQRLGELEAEDHLLHLAHREGAGAVGVVLGEDVVHQRHPLLRLRHHRLHVVHVELGRVAVPHLVEPPRHRALLVDPHAVAALVVVRVRELLRLRLGHLQRLRHLLRQHRELEVVGVQHRPPHRLRRLLVGPRVVHEREAEAAAEALERPRQLVARVLRRERLAHHLHRRLPPRPPLAQLLLRQAAHRQQHRAPPPALAHAVAAAARNCSRQVAAALAAERLERVVDAADRRWHRNADGTPLQLRGLQRKPRCSAVDRQQSGATAAIAAAKSTRRSALSARQQPSP